MCVASKMDFAGKSSEFSRGEFNDDTQVMAWREREWKVEANQSETRTFDKFLREDNVCISCVANFETQGVAASDTDVAKLEGRRA